MEHTKELLEALKILVEAVDHSIDPIDIDELGLLEPMELAAEVIAKVEGK